MNAIHDYRTRRGLSRKQMAQLLGCSPSLVQHIENGIRAVSPTKAVEWEARLGIPREELRPDLFRRNEPETA